MVASFSCRRSGRPPSVLLITIDTLRADRLGSYGRAGAHTPALDRLAREGVRFASVVTPIPRTTPGVASILTGLYPTSHRVRGLWSALPPDVPTLAEWLKSRGRRTGAFASNLFLRPGQGFERGFEVYSNPRNRHEGNSGEEVTQEAIDWLSSLSKTESCFLWVHYLDPHWTYAPSAPYDTIYDPDFRGPWPYSDLAPGRADQGRIIFQNPMTAREVTHAVALYDGEIASVDAQVARLLDALATAGRADDTLILVTSDHGESLGEHGYAFAHGEYLYEGTLLVPWILHWPGHVPTGKVVPRMARLIDIAPTTLALLGEPIPSSVDGRSLTPDLRDAPDAAPRECWIESDHNFIHKENPRHFVDGIPGKWRGLRGERYKLIYIPHDARGEKGETELYDLSVDPHEERNIAAQHPEIAGPMLERLRAYWAEKGSIAPPTPAEPAPDSELLHSLGYL